MSASIMHAVYLSKVIHSVLVDDNGHLQIDVLSGGNTEFLNDATYISGSSKGSVAMGLDASNAELQFIAVDANGHLQVDILTAPTTTIQGDITLGTTAYSEATTKGITVGVVRNDVLATLANNDNEIAPLQVNSSGALYVSTAGSIAPTLAAITPSAVPDSTTDTYSEGNGVYKSNSLNISTKISKLTIWGSIDGVTRASSGYNNIRTYGSFNDSTWVSMGTNFEVTFNSDGIFGATLDIEAPYVKFYLSNANASSRTLTLYYAYKQA